MTERVEEQPYDILENLENRVEIRRYKPQIWAVVHQGNENRAFGTLAGYIFGDNDRNEKIGMTAPVVTMEGYMAFVMPRVYNMETLPKPLTEKITINFVGPRRVAAINFSGFSSPKKKEKNLNQLLDTLKKHEIEVKGKAYVMRYDPPWTPPFMRRNEIAIEVNNK